MPKLSPEALAAMQPEVIYIDRLEYSVLPEKGYVYDADAEFFETEDEALDAALDWSVEEHGARVIIYKNNKPFRKIST
jgi:hypothetical protein